MGIIKEMLKEKIKKDQTRKFKGYESLDLEEKVYQEKALRYIKKYFPRNERCLEIGCADGEFGLMVERELGGEVVGVDVVESLVKKAKEKGLEAVLVKPEEDLPFKEEGFVGVVALEVLEHVYDTDRFLSEVERVLKGGGWLVLSTPNLASLKNRVLLLLGFYPQFLEYSLEGGGHIRLYTKGVLKKQLEEKGFKIVELVSANIICPGVTKSWFPGFLRKLAMKLGDFLPGLGSHLVVIARKK